MGTMRSPLGTSTALSRRSSAVTSSRLSYSAENIFAVLSPASVGAHCETTNSSLILSSTSQSPGFVMSRQKVRNSTLYPIVLLCILLCHKKRSLIRSKRNEQGSKQTYLILLFSAPFSTQHERKSTSPVAMDFAFRQGKPPMGILCVSPRASTQYQHKRRVTRGCGFCVQARQTPMGILCVFPRGLTMPGRKRHVTEAGCACCEALFPMWRCCAEGPRSRVEERRRRRGR